MKMPSWFFDDEAHRRALSDMRSWVEDEIHHYSIGRFSDGSKRKSRLILLAQALDQYSELLYQVVTEQLIDSVTRRVNGLLVLKNEQLTLKNKRLATDNKRLTLETERLTLENKRLVIENKFLLKEAVYYKKALEIEYSIAKKFFSWALDYIITRMKGGASS